MKLVFYAVIFLTVSNCGQFVKFRGDPLDVLKNEPQPNPNPAEPKPNPVDPKPGEESPLPQPIPKKKPDIGEPGNPGPTPTPNPNEPNECSEEKRLIGRLNACIDCLYARPKWECDELCCEEDLR